MGFGYLGGSPARDATRRWFESFELPSRCGCRCARESGGARRLTIDSSARAVFDILTSMWRMKCALHFWLIGCLPSARRDRGVNSKGEGCARGGEWRISNSCGGDWCRYEGSFAREISPGPANAWPDLRCEAAARGGVREGR